jgi:hypothetical protein
MDNTTHETHQTHGSPAGWAMAASATLHCLTGCAIGEVLGMVLSTWWGWHATGSVVLSVALAADTVSILVMEIVDNAVMVFVPGALGAGLANWLFWASLAFSLAVAFVVTVPVNRWMISRGKGHAVVHEYHH